MEARRPTPSSRTSGHEHPACRRAAAPLLPPGEHLTLLLAACGYAPAEIADERGAALSDVVADLRQALDRLGAATVREAVARATRRGLLTPHVARAGTATPPHASAA